MTEYFQLQFKILNRKMIAFGLPLFIGYLLLPILFFILSDYLFSKKEYAGYLFSFVSLSFTTKLSEFKRNDFLKSIYNNRNYLKLRIVENLICSTPFLLYLIVKQFYLIAIITSVLTAVMVLLNFNTNFNFTIPTPFGKKPFEFLVGFRKTFLVFPLAYLLIYISILVENFNLGVFAMLLIAGICLSYYTKLENNYFIWNYNCSSSEFLSKKIQSCFINFTLLVAPILVVMPFFFFNELPILLLFLLLSYAYLATIVLAKYSGYPNDMSFTQGILIAISFMFPPMLLVLIPIFHKQSVKKLNQIL